MSSRLRARAARAAVALALVAGLAPVPAHGYYALAPVELYLGSSAVEVQAGATVAVSCGLSLEAEDQAPGCGMAECPQVCGGLVTPGGVLGGCQDANGWCTCMDSAYSTYYTSVTVYSDNPGVARATYAGGVLFVSGYSAGTATLSLTASLRQHNDGYATVQVTVADPAPAEPAGAGSGDAPSGGSTEGAAGGSSPSPSSSSAAAAPSGASGASGAAAPSGGAPAASVADEVTATGIGVTATGVPTALAAGTVPAANEVQVTAADGATVLLVEANGAVACADELARVAGTDGRCTFWSGGSVESPDISWTFFGRDLDPQGPLSMSLGVSVSGGEGEVAALLGDAARAIVMDWEHVGALPATAEVHVRASGAYDEGAALSLYRYNAATGRFELAREGVVVEGGYATFPMDHCSTWALSADDLAALEPPVAAAGAAPGGAADDIARAGGQDTRAGGNAAPLVAVGACLAAVVAGAALYWRRRLALPALPDAPEGEGEGGSDEG